MAILRCAQRAAGRTLVTYCFKKSRHRKTEDKRSHVSSHECAYRAIVTQKVIIMRAPTALEVRRSVRKTLLDSSAKIWYNAIKVHMRKLYQSPLSSRRKLYDLPFKWTYRIEKAQPYTTQDDERIPVCRIQTLQTVYCRHDWKHASLTIGFIA